MQPGKVAEARSPVFQTRGLTKIYDQGELQVHALRGIDLELFSGELIVMLGASGSGKSTLLNILGGLDVPTSGEVRYRDIDLSAAGDRVVRHPDRQLEEGSRVRLR